MAHPMLLDQGPHYCCSDLKGSLSNMLRFNFPATNNEVDYEALVEGLRIAKKLELSKLKICTDSQLVIGQVKGDFEARKENMKKYL